MTPKDAHARALMEQWISVETSNFSAHAMKFIYHFLFKREQTPEVLQAAEERLELAFGVMDRTLAQQPFLAGQNLSLADICFAPYLEYLALGPIANRVSEHAHVARWWAALRTRPSWRKTIGR